MRDPKDRQKEVFMSFWTKNKEVEVWGYRKKEGSSQEEWKE